MKLPTMTLTSRLAIMLGIFVVASAAAIAATLSALEKQEEYAEVLNLAGRQRMLTQRYAREVLGDAANRFQLEHALRFGDAMTSQAVASRAQHSTAARNAALPTVVENPAERELNQEFTHKYPVKAAFARKMQGGLDSTNDGDYEYSLRSKWNIHPRQGLQSEFDRHAWEAITGDADRTTYWELDLTSAGLTLHYARAEFASSSACLDCHNALPKAPRSDFKIGDLMGMVIVSAPIVRDGVTAAAVYEAATRGGEPPGTKERKLFETSLLALRDGGTTFSDLAMTKETTIPVSDDPDVIAALNLVEQSWGMLTDSAEKMRKPNLSSEETADLVGAVRRQSDDALKKAHAAVVRFKSRVEANLATAKTIQYSTIVATAIGFLLLIVYIRRRVARPVESVLAHVAAGADQTSTQAVRLLRASRSVSEGANKQAVAIQESSASLDEMSSMTKQTAENAQQARRLVAEGTSLVEDAQRSMTGLTSAINEIKKSSDETATVAKTIEQIAFQTNLLALNAAVEAARAGEAGDGFAVVAEEVRNLAQRAGDAARETASLIDGALRSAEHGVEAARAAGQALESVTENEREVADLVAQIATANGEQASGVHQVSLGVEQLDQIMNRNASDATGSLEACEQLSDQMSTLRSNVAAMVGVFGFGGGPAQGRSHPSVSQLPPTPAANDGVFAAPAPVVSAADTAGSLASTQATSPAELIPFDDDDDDQDAKALAEF